MSLLKEISSQIGTFEKIVQSGPLVTQNFSCNDISCATLNAQEKITTNQFQLVSAGSTDGYVLTSDTDGNGAWAPVAVPPPPPSVSLAYGSIGGNSALSVPEAANVSFNLNDGTSPQLINSGFAAVGSTGFTILTPGVYEVNFRLYARNGANAGTTQFLQVGFTIDDAYTFFVARSTVANVGNGTMMCDASWIYRFGGGNLVQLQNITNAIITFDASDTWPTNYSFNRMFSMTQLTRE